MKRFRLLGGLALMACSIAWGAVATQALPPGSPAAPGMVLSPVSGDSSTEMTLSLTAPDNACPGDTATGNYRWNTFMVPSSVDVGTLTYNNQGPISPAGVTARPLFSAIGGSSIVNRATAVQTGQIVGTSTVSFAVFAPGDIAPGSYKIGYACTKPPALGQPAQTERFWQTEIAVTQSATGGPAQIAWTNGTPTTVPPTVPITAPITVPPTMPPPPPTGTLGTGNTISVTSGNNGTSFSLNVVAPSNTCQGDTATGGYRFHQYIAAASIAPASIGFTAGAFTAPGGGFVQPLYSTTGSPQVNKATAINTGQLVGLSTLNFNTNTLPGNGQYNVGFICTLAGVTTRYWVTPITVTDFVAPSTFSWTAVIVPPPSGVTQTIFATKAAAGSLIIQQRCGTFGAAPAVNDPDLGFLPSLPAVPASPVPSSLCGIDLGTTTLVNTGPRQGQFYGATGRINQIEVVDTRQGNQPWTVSAQFGSFSNGGTGSNDAFTGNLLGWQPQVTNAMTPAGNTDFNVIPGPEFAPTTAPTPSLPRTLATAFPGKTAGFVQLDARLKLLIPATANSGRFSASITFTVI